MGYTTEFYGKFSFNKEVPEKLMEYVNRFCLTRRMKRDVNKIKEIYPNWEEYSYNGDLGVEGEYFAMDDGYYGQTKDASILEYNFPAITQPGLWCKWIITKDENNYYLEWDGSEKFYDYVEWLKYLIDHFFTPNGLILNGVVAYQGEREDDNGHIFIIDDNKIITNGVEIN